MNTELNRIRRQGEIDGLCNYIDSSIYKLTHNIWEGYKDGPYYIKLTQKLDESENLITKIRSALTELQSLDRRYK